MSQNQNNWDHEEFDLDDIVNEFKDYTPQQAEPATVRPAPAPIRQETQSTPRSTAQERPAAAQQRPVSTPPANKNPRTGPAPAARPASGGSKSGGGKQILTGILCFLAVAVLVVGAYLGVQALRRNQAQTPPTTATEAPVQTQPAPDTEAAAQPTIDETGFVEPTNPVVDVQEYEPEQRLLDAIAVNPEVVGLLNYGAYSSLFVTQAADNEYYLDHDYALNSSWTGAPFFDARCRLSPRSTNLMIHGHNMKNGTIFSDFVNFYEESYTHKYPIVSLAKKDALENYVIFAVTDVETDPTASDYFKITEWDFDSGEAFTNYVGYMQSHSRFTLPVDVQPGDQLLILSTCNYIGSDGRLLICCRMLRDGETIDSIRTLFGSDEA